MTFDDLQQEWKSNDHRPTTTIDTDLLAKMIERNYKDFEESQRRSDLRGFLLGAFFIGLFLWIKLYYEQVQEYWPYWMAIAWLVVFVPCSIGQCLIRRLRRPKLDDSILSCLGGSIFQMEYQIWWVRNFFWFFTLPTILFFAAFAILCCWSGEIRSVSSYIVGFGISLIMSTYIAKQKCERIVDEKWVPQRDELKSLLDSLGR